MPDMDRPLVTAAGDGGVDVEPDEAWRRVESGAVLVDVRELAEHATGTIPGAIPVPCGSLESVVPERVPDTDTEVVCYCTSGSRSRLAARILAGVGYRRVRSVVGGAMSWRAAGLPWEPTPGLTPDQHERYARHLVLPEVGVAGQRRLLESTVLVVGAGGLGSPAAMYLAAAGVGRLVVADADTVDTGNLQRQVLHSTDRVGMAKIESARVALAALNPEVTLDTRPDRVSAGNVLEVLGDADVVVDGADDFPTRYLLNDASLHTGISVVHGSVLRFEGQVSVFTPHRGPCYRCLYPLPPPPALAPSCATAGVLGVLPGVIGTIQAVEALKILLGIGDTLAGRLLAYDALGSRFMTFEVARDPSCPACADPGAPPPLVDYDPACRPVPTG